MRAGSAYVAQLLTQSHRVYSTLAVYYNGVPVLDAVPINDGSLEVDSTQDVPATLTASVPRFITTAAGKILDLMPSTSGSPLACDGTRVAVSYAVTRPGGAAETLNLGWYRISEWEEGDGTVDLTATGLEAIVQEATLINPATIAAGTTYAAATKTLVGGLLPLRVTAPAAKITAAQSFEDDRIAALGTLLDAWPARMGVDDSGTLVIAKPYDDVNDRVVLTLTEGENGTVVAAPRSGTRDGVYNAVKASGEDNGDTAPVSAVAYLTTGPFRWNGPFGNVPYFYSSPLLTTAAACQSAAKTRLANLQVTASAVTVEAAPDPRVQVGDVVELVQTDQTRRLRVDSLALPLTAEGGTMTVTGHQIEEAA